MTKLSKKSKQATRKNGANFINLEPIVPHVKNVLYEDMYFLSTHTENFETAKYIYEVLESNKTENDTRQIAQILKLSATNICFQVSCDKMTQAEFEPIFKFFNEIPYSLEEGEKNDTFFLKRIVDKKSGWRKICNPKKAKQIPFDEELCSQIPQHQFFDTFSPYKQAAEVISMLFKGELVQSSDIKKLFFKMSDVDTLGFEIRDERKFKNNVLNKVLNIVTHSYSMIAKDELWDNFVEIIKEHPIDLLSSLAINMRLLNDAAMKDQITTGFNLVQDILNIFAQALTEASGKEINFLQRDEKGDINLSWLEEMDRVAEAFVSKYASHLPDSDASVADALVMISRLYRASNNPIKGLQVALKAREIYPANQFRDNDSWVQHIYALNKEEQEVYLTKLMKSLTLIPQGVQEKLLSWFKMSFKSSNSYDQEFLQEYETLKVQLEKYISTIDGSDPLICSINTLFAVKQLYFYRHNNDITQVENLLGDLEGNQGIPDIIKQDAKIETLYYLSFKPGFSKFIDIIKFHDVHAPDLMMQIAVIYLNLSRNAHDFSEQNLYQAFNWLKNANKLFFADNLCVDGEKLSIVNQFVIMEFIKLGVNYHDIQKELFYIPQLESFENLIAYLQEHKISFNIGLGEIYTVCMPGSDITLEELLHAHNQVGLIEDDVLWYLVNQYYKDIKDAAKELINPAIPSVEKNNPSWIIKGQKYTPSNTKLQDETKKIYAVTEIGLEKNIADQLNLALEKGLAKRELGPRGLKIYKFGKAGEEADQLYKAYFKISEGLRVQCKLYFDKDTGATLAYGDKIVSHDRVEAFKIQKSEAYESLIETYQPKQEGADTTLEEKGPGNVEENAIALHISFDMNKLGDDSDFECDI